MSLGGSDDDVMTLGSIDDKRDILSMVCRLHIL